MKRYCGLFALILLGISGCAPTVHQTTTKIISSKPTHQSYRTGQHKHMLAWTLHKEGLRVLVKRRPYCKEIDGAENTIQPTRTYKASGWAVTGLLVSIAAGATGAILIPVASNQPNDGAFVYSLSAVIIGAGVLGAGLAIGTMIRTMPDKLPAFKEEGERTSRTVLCGEMGPASGLRVSLVIGDAPRAATTDKEGKALIKTPPLGSISTREASAALVSVGDDKATIDLSGKKIYRDAVAAMAKRKREEEARRKQEEADRAKKRREQLRLAHIQRLAPFRNSLFKAPRVMVSTDRAPTCKIPKLPCESNPIRDDVQYKVIASYRGFWGLADDEAKGAPKLDHIEHWVPHKALETLAQNKRRMAREARAEARRRRLAQRKARIAISRNSRRCRTLRRRIRWRGSCRLILKMVESGASLSSAVRVARTIHRRLQRLTMTISRYPGVAVCMRNNGFSYVRGLMELDKGATEDNMKLLVGCYSPEGDVGLLFMSRVWSVTLQTTKTIFSFY